LPEIFSLSESEYGALHQSFLRALRVLPPGVTLHKQDWFREANYQAGFGDNSDFMQHATERFFHERPYLDHECLIFITLPLMGPGGKPATGPGRSAAGNLIRPSLLHKSGGASAVQMQQLEE